MLLLLFLKKNCFSYQRIDAAAVFRCTPTPCPVPQYEFTQAVYAAHALRRHTPAASAFARQFHPFHYENGRPGRRMGEVVVKTIQNYLGIVLKGEYKIAPFPDDSGLALLTG
jgi:hypothetical protein